MIFRISIDARNPRHVATVLAELLGAEAVEVPHGWIARSADGDRAHLEVIAREGAISDAQQCRFSMRTPLQIAEIFAIAGREGWPARYRKRAGSLGVIELGVEGDRTIELLTADMQAEYRERVTARQPLPPF